MGVPIMLDKVVLRSWMLNESSPSVPQRPASFAVVDVRDDDYIGGHIHSSHHYPSSNLACTLPSLYSALQSVDALVFHCALSQQRGPKAASMYMRYREMIDPPRDSSAEFKKQQVYVLRGGFTEWQQEFGRDSRLTEAYEESIWKYY
ncbi:Rhodanese-like domain-containing protein [Dipodascopsis uninucleata]